MKKSPFKVRKMKKGKVYQPVRKAQAEPDANLTALIARHKQLARRLEEAKSLYGQFDELTEYLLRHASEIAKHGGVIIDSFHPTGKSPSNKTWKSVCFNRFQISWRA